jgi:predicted enzyme related to lactoylglutathione lyase
MPKKGKGKATAAQAPQAATVPVAAEKVIDPKLKSSEGKKEEGTPVPISGAPTTSSGADTTVKEEKKDECPSFNPGAICHLDIFVRDLNRAIKFYTDVFKWECDKPLDEIPYSLWRSGPQDKRALGGGFCLTTVPASNENAFSHMPYINVPNIADALTKVHERGGAVSLPAMPVMPNKPEMGSFGMFLDTEGNPTGVYSTEAAAIPVKNLEQTVRLKMSPSEFYEAWLDSTKHTEKIMKGQKNVIDRKPLGLFDTNGGAFKGRLIEMVENKKIVQSLYDWEFPKGHFTKLSLLINDGGSGTTALTLKQESIPATKYDTVLNNWVKLWEDIGAVDKPVSKEFKSCCM